MSFEGDLRGAAAAAERLALPATVGVGERGQVGSGMVVAPNRVLTSAHNVRFQGRSVHFPDGTRREAESATSDLSSDLAVLTVDTGNIAPISWAEQEAELGLPVLAAANPGGRGHRLSLGMVAAVDRIFPGPNGRRIGGAFEHTAPLPRGSSGGPVLNWEGRLLGIDTRRSGEGLYTALSAGPTVRSLVERLSAGEVPQAGWLGLALLPPEMARRLRQAVGLPERQGALVRQVTVDSPAEKAGVRQGDLIVGAHGKPLQSGEDLERVLHGLTPGVLVPLTLVRGTEELEVVAVAAAEPADWSRGRHHGRGRHHRED